MATNISYGFIGLQHVFDQRIEDVGIQTIRDAVTFSLQKYTQELNAMMAQLVTPTTEWKKRYQLPFSGTHQPLDEWGNPLPTRPSGFYDIAFPIQGGGSAFGDNRVSRQLMTVEEMNDLTWMVQLNDIDWVRRHVLAALFTNVSWTYDDPAHGSLTVVPLANNDSTVYMRTNGVASADNHYLAQANTVGNGADNPFPTIYNELVEHPGNNGPIVAFIPTNLVSAVTALTDFVEVVDPDIQVGISTDQLRGVPAAIRSFGGEVLGKTNKVWIVEWKQLPDNYILAVDLSATDIVWMRQYPAAALQGLFPEFHSPDGNVRETRAIRYAGFGVANRVGAVVQRVGNGTYAIPTGYTAPLLV